MVDYFIDLETNVTQALAEDIGDGDITAQLIDANTEASAEVITREPATICGRRWVDEVFRQIDPTLNVIWGVDDAVSVKADTWLFTVKGKAQSILTGERTALNFLQTLSATATTTKTYADLIAHTNTKLLDTRKTIPGLRRAQKYAVSCGGGVNHRMGLYDAFLIKENHIQACGSIKAAIQRARAMQPHKKLEIEVEGLEEFYEASEAQPDWIMLDNFSLSDMQQAVANNPTRIKLEASGGIEQASDLVQIAETGVDYISVGALTKHCKAIDLSMRLR